MRGDVGVSFQTCIHALARCVLVCNALVLQSCNACMQEVLRTSGCNGTPVGGAVGHMSTC